MSHSATTLREQLLAWLHDHEQQMFELLEKVVNIDSGSFDKRGVDKVNAVFREKLEAGGVATKVYAMPEHGDCLFAEVPANADVELPHVLLLGHMDTVFPAGTVTKRPYSVKDGIAYGPGVADMKAGLVMNTYIVLAFAELGGNHTPIRLLFTGDEEIASPASRSLIAEIAQGAGTVLNAEPGRPSGNVVTERKGAFFIDFDVRGVAAHAGVAHDKGASAIDAIARKIVALHYLTDTDAGITSNVGLISGGVSVNTVAPHASAKLDVRFPKNIDEDELHRRIVNIIEAEEVPCTCGRVTREGRFLPLFQTDESRALLADYTRAAYEIGLTVRGEATGGSADSGFTASAGAPTLCGTGPVGGHVHTEDEYCVLSTVVPRAQAAMLTILGRDVLLRDRS